MIRKKRTGNLKRSKFLKKQGFTLIELVVVMAIIAVLAVLVIGAITIAKHMATETANRSNAKTIQTAMEAYYSRHQAYPPMNGASFYRAATDASYQLTPSFVSLSSLSNSACDTSNTKGRGYGGNIISGNANIVGATGANPWATGTNSNSYTILIANYNCDMGTPASPVIVGEITGP